MKEDNPSVKFQGR